MNKITQWLRRFSRKQDRICFPRTKLMIRVVFQEGLCRRWGQNGAVYFDDLNILNDVPSRRFLVMLYSDKTYPYSLSYMWLYEGYWVNFICSKWFKTLSYSTAFNLTLMDQWLNKDSDLWTFCNWVPEKKWNGCWWIDTLWVYSVWIE